MKKFILLLAVGLVSLSGPVRAETEIDFSLAERAVGLSAVVDAYGEYCNKPSKLADEYIAQFQEVNLSNGKILELKNLQKNKHDDMLEGLKAEKKDCKDVKFLLKRLEIMRSLKDVSYELNGIDPATVEDHIPALEMLAPDEKMAIAPSDVPPEPETKEEQH